MPSVRSSASLSTRNPFGIAQGINFRSLGWKMLPSLAHHSPSMALMLLSDVAATRSNGSASAFSECPVHEAFFLLKNFLALRRVQYLLRTTPCFLSPESALFDEEVHRIFTLI